LSCQEGSRGGGGGTSAEAEKNLRGAREWYDPKHLPGGKKSVRGLFHKGEITKSRTLKVGKESVLPKKKGANRGNIHERVQRGACACDFHRLGGGQNSKGGGLLTYRGGFPVGGRRIVSEGPSCNLGNREELAGESQSSSKSMGEGAKDKIFGSACVALIRGAWSQNGGKRRCVDITARDNPESEGSVMWELLAVGNTEGKGQENRGKDYTLGSTGGAGKDVDYI